MGDTGVGLHHPTGDTMEKIVKTDQEWQAVLNPAEFRVLRREGTEQPYSSELNSEHRRGVYQCRGCGQPLFHAASKFNSGTGWPSFHTAIDGSLETRTDFKLILPRTEYHCARCGGHHGHVFNDGPQPSGKRYCSNGIALVFVADDETQRQNQ